MSYSLAALEQDFGTVYRTLRRERMMRERVLRHDSTLKAKLAEIDAATAALVRMKDALKLRQMAEGQEEAYQGTLLDGEVKP